MNLRVLLLATVLGASVGTLVAKPDPAAVLDAMERAALSSCLEPDGRPTHVQPAGHTPVSFDSHHTEAFGVGAFLLAGSEIHRLALSLKSRTE
ncbi:MAG TPA: hypothetical protein VMM36_15365 [Opitutaceae bacterium]|nr:hypothetical protein [Opitutaceae bacterium]